uniref:Oxidation resistance protein 1 n=1 Tax=Trieres chinensis TaxID=1514140 RepID=A0A7S2E797_TRICV|mmetsp:Transcript_10690/g.22409  ORF Transcript_10690/g.22409 Transcript_10690/m.22409 type:complete len:371 (+) Transcript_10690:56-1168(+)
MILKCHPSEADDIVCNQMVDDHLCPLAPFCCMIAPFLTTLTAVQKRELTKMRMNQDSSWEIDKGSSALEQKLQAVRGATKIERRVAAESAWGGVAGVAGICSAGSDSGGEVGSADDDEYYEGEGEDDHGKPHIKVSSPHSTPSGDGLAVDVDVPDDGDDTEEFVRIVIDPEPKTRDGDSPVPFLLKESHMRQIALRVLPPAIMLNRWARLYSLLRDGDSFDAFLRLTKDTQRSLLVVRTANGDIFGAYSDSPFEVKSQSLAAQFYGSAQACLWTLDTEGSGEKVGGDGEGTIKAYKWTGANRYIQLVDIRHKMIAFGGGGNAGEFGLCVEDDFQRGTTGPCGTFGNDPLCDQPTFEIVDLECWGFLSGFG